ncbi:DUF1629 domain-containing protein [Singulisphaera sp. Ch08]|uniref:DUF1629 domain-containing protein n=1 Tax=Singulisphaera sp. Ch08 TaxID=3120278 RepID=A0AAU7CMT9_9BACT
MAYYLYRPDANAYAGIGVSLADDARVMNIHFLDRSLTSGWIPIHCHGFDENPHADGDFPSLSNFWRVPIFSERAWDSLRPVIGGYCEALPIVHPNGKPHFIINVRKFIDCIDTEKSQMRRYTDGMIMKLIKYSFNSNLDHNFHIFKLPRETAGELLVDEEFRRAVEANGLRGLLFEALPTVDATRSP